MYCSQCGQPLEQGDLYCPACGTKNKLLNLQVASEDSPQTHNKNTGVIVAVVVGVLAIIALVIAIINSRSAEGVNTDFTYVRNNNYGFATYYCYVQNGNSNEYIRNSDYSFSLYPYDSSSFPIVLADDHGMAYISVNGVRTDLTWELDEDHMVIYGYGDPIYCQLIDSEGYAFYMLIDGHNVAFFVLGVIPPGWEQIDENTRVCYD